MIYRFRSYSALQHKDIDQQFLFSCTSTNSTVLLFKNLVLDSTYVGSECTGTECTLAVTGVMVIPLGRMAAILAAAAAASAGFFDSGVMEKPLVITAEDGLTTGLAPEQETKIWLHKPDRDEFCCRAGFFSRTQRRRQSF